MALSHHHNESVVRTVAASMFFRPIEGCAEEMGCRLTAGAVNVEVLEEVAHLYGNPKVVLVNGFKVLKDQLIEFCSPTLTIYSFSYVESGVLEPIDRP